MNLTDGLCLKAKNILNSLESRLIEYFWIFTTKEFFFIKTEFL